MKNKTSIISVFLLFFVSTAGAFFASPVSADENSLIVDFENTPLFSEANFLPGNSVTRFAKVTNNTGETETIIIEAINPSDPDDLGDVFDIKIVEGINELYNGTLSNFFAAREIVLSDLAGGGTQTQYDVTVSFQSGADDPFQEKSLGFDVLIGFQGEEEVVDPPTGGGGGGGGGSKASTPPGLSIPSETIRVTEIQETSVTVLWTTSYFSTSQVIYATEEEPRALNLSAPNYGYPHAAPDPEDTNKVLFHSVTVTGLIPETTYFFRVVSHASPATISRELNFDTLASSGIVAFGELGETGIPSVDGEQGSVPSDDPQGSGQGTGSGDTTGKTTGESEESQEDQKNIFEAFGASAIGGVFTPGNIAFVAAILFILFLLRKRKKKKKNEAETPQDV